MAAEKIIDSLKFTFEEADEQKDLFTPSHVLYKCRIINPANNRRYTFDYQCNPSATHEPEKKDCLYCLLSDSSCVESCTDEADFLTEFGYIDGGADQIRKGLKAFKACQRTKKAMVALDMAGGEKLMGHGDMLFLPNGSLTPVRLQGGFVSETAINNIVGGLMKNQ